MGFIPNSITRTLTAYLTQKGREYLVAGDKDGLTIKNFALGDPDVNYLVASQPGQDTTFNMLPAGSIPDLSGDDDGAIHSLAGGITQRYFISGGTNVRQIGTDLNFNTVRQVVRFSSVVTNVNLTKRNTGFEQFAFNIPLEVLGAAPTGFERVKMYLLPPSQGTSPEVYASLTADNGNGGIYSWAAGSPQVQQATCTLGSSISRPGTFNYVAKFRLAPFKSAVTIDPSKNIITVYIAVTLPGSSSSSSSIGIGISEVPTELELIS